MSFLWLIVGKPAYEPLWEPRVSWSSWLMDVNNIGGASYERPVYKLFIEPHVIVQRKHLRREPPPHLAGSRKERTSCSPSLIVPGANNDCNYDFG